MAAPRMIKINDHEQYSLGDSLGRGAFGSVFRGLNTHSGETVAVKQIKLKNIAETEATEIMGEIDLLKNLNHPNIVKYHCFYKSIDSLYIVLEYCENGSLASICKAFGVFPEHLVAVYTDQVLLGLIYLHDQGVIHRDIKGANILTTKDGTVKLADFGVATNVLSDMTVVGSPYWMAPEIIELAGATSASDIWSLGCVIIELLQGRPPYSDMDQMSALFHIVDDEHPPFPDGASAGARDFLVRCFQKNPNLRTSAKKLRRHNWITNHVKNGSLRSKNSHKSSPLDFDDAVNSVQEYNEKVNGPDLVVKTTTRPHSQEKPVKVLKALRKAIPIQKHFEDPEEDWSKDLEFKSAGGAIRMPLTLKPSHNTSRSPQKSVDSVWDDDFDGGVSALKLKLSRSNVLSTHTRQARPMSPSQRPTLQHSKSAVPLSRRRSPERTILSDSTIRPSSSQLARGLVKTPPGTPIARRASSTRDLLRSSKSTSVDHVPQHPQTAQLTSIKTAEIGVNRSILSLQQYADEQEDYSDILGNVDPTASIQGSKFNSSELSNKSWLQDDDAGDDPFADIEEFEKENLTANVLREQKARAIQQMELLMKSFQAGNKHEHELLECAREIQDLLSDHPDLKPTIISSHGLLPLLETLESCTEDELILVILELLNVLALDDDEVQENISFVGGISSVTKFAYKRYSQEIRTQAAMFVRQMLASSDLNAQIFVSCRGLAILTELLEEDYHEARTLVMTGIDGIIRVFSLQGKYTPRNDLCRIMARTGVLEPLTHTLHILNTGEKDADDQQAISSILSIMLTFSQADEYVKQLIATRTVLKRLMMNLNLMTGDHLITALKFVKSLSSVTSTLEVLHNANTIECLVKLLSDTALVSYQEVANHILTTLFNLCRIDKARQYEAATVGLIPILKRIVSNDRPMKDMALPMLCNMAHNKDCRRLLWSQRGLDFYVKLLADPFWQVNAFEAIVVWFFEEPARVEKSLLETNAVDALIAAFASARGVPFESLLDQLQKLLKASRRLSRVFNTPSFLTRLLDRLNHPKPTVRANLLKLLQSVLDAGTVKSHSFGQYDIVKVLTDLSEKDGAIIVKALAGSTLRAMEDRNAGESFHDAKEQQSWERIKHGRLNGGGTLQHGVR